MSWTTLTLKLVSKQTCGRCGKYDYLRDVFMLDTGLTIPATVTNPDLVTNIGVSKNPLTTSTNAGTKTLRYEANIEGFGPAMYDEDQIANIMGFTHMVKHNRIQYDNLYPGNEAENVFKVHTDAGMVEFSITDEGLYTYKPTENYMNYVQEQKRKEPRSFMISTVDENKKIY